MRFMLILKGDPGNPEDQRPGTVADAPNEELVSAMIAFNHEMIDAGVLIGAEGLLPSSEGVRVVHKRMARTVVDGPFAEAKELVAGYFIIEVDSLEEAVEWASKVPVHHALTSDEDEAVVEVRRIASLDEVEGATEEHQRAERELRERLVGP
jgi:hypothetical protein